MRVYSGSRMVVGIALAALVSGCGGSGSAPEGQTASLDGPGVKSALAAIQRRSDPPAHEHPGRRCARRARAGHPGIRRRPHYVETTLKSYGVEPAGEGGTFRQRVPLRNSVVVEDKSSMKVTSRAGAKTLSYGVDYLLGGDQLREQVAIDNAPVAFVGYGVSAPALGYDDYANAVSVEGKVVAYLSGAPPSLPSNERAYFSSGAVKDAEAVETRGDRHDQLHVARRSALPVGRQCRYQQAGQLRLDRCAGPAQSR